MTKPTIEAIELLQTTYDFFNDHFFCNALPPAMITYQKTRGFGYHWPGRWRSRDDKDTTISEIGINPDYLEKYGDMEAAQTLLHEMCHLWQHTYGKPSRGGYHNREWATKMLEVGLTPSSTGKPGGKQTGQSVADYPTPNGRFLEIWPQLQQLGFRIKWATTTPTPPAQDDDDSDTDATATAGSKSKQKFTCPDCGQNAWAKPSASLICGNCEITMESQ